MNKARKRELASEWEAIQKKYASMPKFGFFGKAPKPNKNLSLKDFSNYRGADELKKLKSLMTPGGSTAVTSKVDPFNLRNEPEHVKEEILHKASCTAPVHKSSYVYVTEGMNPASLGRKNEVL